MNNFVQNVFNKISLERNPALWQSEDDSQMPKRIKFLSEFEETLFSSQLFNEKNVSKGLRKNAVLCSAFKKKFESITASSREDQEKKLTLLNQALSFCEIPEKGSENYHYPDNIFVQLIHQRITIFSSLKYTKEAIEDIKVLEEYHDSADINDPKLVEYYGEFQQLKFNLTLDSLCLDQKKATEYRQKFKTIKESKDNEAIEDLVSSLEKILIQEGDRSIANNEGNTLTGPYFYRKTI